MIASATAGTLATWVVYRTSRQERALDNLRARVEDLAGELRKTRELVEALKGSVRAAASRGPRVSTAMISASGSFESAMGADMDGMSMHTGYMAGSAASLVAASAAEDGAAGGSASTTQNGGSSRAAAPSPWQQADALFDASEHERTIDHLGGMDERPEDDAERLWRLARALHGMAGVAGRAGHKGDQKHLIETALARVQRAMELDPRNFAARKWAGIVVSEASGLEGTKASIQQSFVVRAHFEAAVDLNPRDPTSRHLLGLWHYEVASISWATAKVAAALFSTPPSSTYDEALRHLLAAEEIQPGFYKKNQLLIAKALVRKGNTDEACRWLDAAAALPVLNADDEAAHAEVLLEQRRALSQRRR